MIPLCEICSSEMVQRKGTYGPFWFCPSTEHKFTLSVKGVLRQKVLTELSNLDTNRFPYPYADLVDFVKTTFGPVDPLIEFYVDNPYDAQDDEDHWMNVRPY